MDTALFGLPGYAELQCSSNFSFLHGASHAEELSARAAQLGYTAIAVTDECSLAGVVRAHVAAKEAGIKLLVGAQFHLTNADGSHAVSLIAIAQNREGYGNLCELITLARTRTAKGSYLLTPRDLDHPEPLHHHLRGLADCLVIVVPDFPANGERLEAQVAWAADTFPGRAWVALTLLSRAMDDIHRDVVETVAGRHDIPVVATGNVLMHVRSRKPLQDTLTAIRVGLPVAECGFDLAPNAEQHLRSRLRLANLYPREALTETLNVSARCTFSLDELRYEYSDELVPDNTTPTGVPSRNGFFRTLGTRPVRLPISRKPWARLR